MKLIFVVVLAVLALTTVTQNIMAVSKGGSSSTETSSSPHTPSSSSNTSPPSSSSNTSPPSSSSNTSPPSSHRQHHTTDSNNGAAAGVNDGKVGVYDLASACPSGSSNCKSDYKEAYVKTCTHSQFGCGDGPTTFGPTGSKESHGSSTSSSNSNTNTQTITNLVIQVSADNLTNWDGNYCCAPGTMTVQNMGNFTNPYTGTQQFEVACSGTFSAGARIDSSASNPPQLTISVLKNGKVIGSSNSTSDYTWATVHDKCS